MNKLRITHFVPTISQIVIGWLVATAAAVFLTSLWYFAPSGNNSAHAPRVFLHYSIICYGWAFLVIFVKPVVERIGWDQQRIARSIGMLLLVGLICSVAHYLLTSGVVRGFGLLSGQAIHGPVDSWPRFFGVIQSNLLLYIVIASICLALFNDRKYRERALRTSKLESQLTTAKLDSLKAQLRPHFLFNSLNAIASLTQSHPKTAEAMIVQLSDLLRMTLDLRNDDLHCLQNEIELARKYLAIEQLRFGQRMQLEISIGPEVSQALVPTLILQPFVENAVRHGVAQTTATCSVTIVAKKDDNQLLMTIEDDCEKPFVSNEMKYGIGTENCLERLKGIYGSQYELIAQALANKGFRVSIAIPFELSSIEE